MRETKVATPCFLAKVLAQSQPEQRSPMHNVGTVTFFILIGAGARLSIEMEWSWWNQIWLVPLSFAVTFFVTMLYTDYKMRCGSLHELWLELRALTDRKTARLICLEIYYASTSETTEKPHATHWQQAREDLDCAVNRFGLDEDDRGRLLLLMRKQAFPGH